MWNARFGFFWYNDEEIFNFTEEDFDKKAAEFADVGINIVITFSCTHFRWTMRPYWTIINATIEKIVKSCHKYGIRVVEHHSSHLTFDPLNDEDWDYMERILNVRKSSISSWPGIREYMASDPDVAGNRLSSFRQIDGRTGGFARTPYRGYGMCFNNPDYQRAYFNYLESVYKTGIDGIMTDDVQWFGEGNACACKHCRVLFKERTGYELPSPGDEWAEFFRNYDNPVYIAWEKFRRQTTADFQDRVNEHFKSLGLELLRPNYISSILSSNHTAYPFEAAAHIWDWMFQENVFSTILKYSWITYQPEAVHRYAFALRYGVPSMSMFYPDREDSFYFSWALAASWGQLFLATPEGKDMTALEKRFRHFESKYSKLLHEQKKLSDAAVYLSSSTRDYVKDAAEKNMKLLIALLQGSYLSNLQCDMVFEKDNLETLSRHAMIILPRTEMMSELELCKLRQYAENGGILIVLGIPGLKDENGVSRDIDLIFRYFGLEDERKNSGEVIFNAIGKGRIILYKNIDASTVSGINLQRGATADRFQRKEVPAKAPYYVVDELKALACKYVSSNIKERLLQLTDWPAEWLVTCYMDKENTGMMFHIVNTEGTLEKEQNKEIYHRDLIPAFSFTRDKGTDCSDSAAYVSVKTSGGRIPEKAILITPERDEEIELKAEYMDGRYFVEIPGGAFRGYGLIYIKF